MGQSYNRRLAAGRPLCYSFQSRREFWRGTSHANCKHSNLAGGTHMIAIRSLWIAALVFMVMGFGRNPLPAAQNTAQESPVAKLTQADLDEGKQLYAAECAGCHGVDGSGGMGPNIRASAQARGDQGMFSVIRNGVSGMGPVMSLNDKRAWQVVGYVRTFGGSASGEAAKGDPAKGKAVYATNGCAGCHAIAGQGS